MNKIYPIIILVRPQLSENIGMTARVMDNFGLSKLFIVKPREEWPSKIAENSAKHGKNIIKNAKIFDNLEDAVSKCNMIIATTNRKRFLSKKIITSFFDLKKTITNFQNSAILFGPENSGLSNKDLRLANYIFTINTASSSKSLNLSHAVSVIAYELFQSEKINVFSKKNNQIVAKLELSNYLNTLINDLDSNGFFKPLEKKESMIDNIYSIYNKMYLTKKELRMLWGIYKKLKKQPKS
ncbi:MAG: RNA methyltransferase [Candidatus Marinimicrobia bacterium]|nr:RNA methyltransferase [Candidatus Neomarinimicrobiota bacterium]